MSNKWSYGNLYKKHNMDGVIEMPNNSKVQVCDWLKQLPSFMCEADTLFVDPPWNIGNVNCFYTKADKPHLNLDFEDFSNILFERIETINPDFLFIEIGKEYLGFFLERIKMLYKYITFYNSTYYKKKSNKCYVIHATNIYKLRRYKELEDLDEEKIIEWLCKNHEYKCIGDLCMGLGLVGKYAYLNNKKFVGLELNKKRLAVLVDFINENEKRKTYKVAL